MGQTDCDLDRRMGFHAVTPIFDALLQASLLQTFNPDKIREMRNAGTPWRAIAKRLGVGTGTACRALQQIS